MQANQAKASGPNKGFTNSGALWAIAYKANTLKLVPTIVCGRENSQNALTQLCGPEPFLSIQDLPIASLLINIKCPLNIFFQQYQLQTETIINVACSRVSIFLASPKTSGKESSCPTPALPSCGERRGGRDLDPNKRDGWFNVKLSLMDFA